ncbi:DNA integrity scanning protein DisA with diadenylate cyclase activity [Lipingzhangella halophila]|uniref:DNA integrity scanning protein DisA with diadenylate cyclase activity n=1 Tax=Lipingzhangella halophila TaxID=1783352 RepID=A0A7W7RGL9_9ACTN|nr:DNA integrity scanning protein DisA with diadenylate cyclase activity [Lipingzhangella halophila]
MNVRAALAFGTPLREGIELIRQQGLGALVVLGYDRHDGKLFEGGHATDEPVTDEAIRRAALNDGATVLSPSLDRIARERTFLRPQAIVPAGAGGTRHLTAARCAAQTGRPVVAVSEERQAVTLYRGTERYLLLTALGLRAVIDDVMNALRAIHVQDAIVGDQARQGRLDEARGLLREVDGHLVELGAAGRIITSECATIASTLGLAWAPSDVAPFPIHTEKATTKIP